MTYTIEQIRQLNLHGPQTVMELCDEIERLQKHLETIRGERPCPKCEGTGIIVEPAHAKGCDGSCVSCPVP